MSTISQDLNLLSFTPKPAPLFGDGMGWGVQLDLVAPRHIDSGYHRDGTQERDKEDTQERDKEDSPG